MISSDDQAGCGGVVCEPPRLSTVALAPTPNVAAAVTLAALSFGALGAALTLPGTLLPLLVEQFRIRLVEAGSMMALQPIGYVASVLVAGRLIQRFGMRLVLTVALGTAASGFIGFGAASSWIGGAAMMLVTGLGFGVMEVASNTLLIQIGGARRANVLNLAHLFFGVGSFIGPTAATRVVAAGLSWRVPFAGAGGLLAAVAVGWSLFRLPAPASGDPSEPAAAPAAVDTRLAALLATTLAVYVGVEMGIGGWLTKYMVGIRGVALTSAGTALSLYWMGLAAGRLVLSALSHHVREEALLLGLSLCATAALWLALAADAPRMTVVCFTLTGAGFSGIFPAVIALGGRCHPHHTARVTSVMIAGAGLGGIVIPWTMSAIADVAGVAMGMGFYAAMAVVLVALVVVVRRSLPVEAEASGA